MNGGRLMARKPIFLIKFWRAPLHSAPKPNHSFSLSCLCKSIWPKQPEKTRIICRITAKEFKHGRIIIHNLLPMVKISTSLFIFTYLFT